MADRNVVYLPQRLRSDSGGRGPITIGIVGLTDGSTARLTYSPLGSDSVSTSSTFVNELATGSVRYDRPSTESDTGGPAVRIESEMPTLEELLNRHKVAYSVLNWPFKQSAPEPDVEQLVEPGQRDLIKTLAVAWTSLMTLAVVWTWFTVLAFVRDDFWLDPVSAVAGNLFVAVLVATVIVFMRTVTRNVDVDA